MARNDMGSQGKIRKREQRRKDKGGAGQGRGRKGGSGGQARAKYERKPLEPQQLDEGTGLPLHLVESVQAAWAENASRVLGGWEAAHGRPVTLRANTLLAGADEVAAALDATGLAFERVPWYADAFVLGEGASEKDLWELDVYKQGKVYLQSLSSMLPPLALAPRTGADILDMCAAPGGKTSEMAALAAGADGVRAARITACELSHPRAEKLEHNLAKLGASNVQVMRCDASKLDGWFSFDQVLLDAPCTGSGTVTSRDEHAAKHLRPELADGVERSQRALLDKGLEVLKAGGELVYSTCSVLPRENEDVVSWALKRHKDCELVGLGFPEGALGEGKFALPTLPCRLQGAVTVCPTKLYEGFFIAKIRKLG